MGDVVIAVFFADDQPKRREKRRIEIESWLGGVPVAWDKLAAIVLAQDRNAPIPFHWEIEFPEVFSRAAAGFDAIVGNPPFLGGSRISSHFGKGYLLWLLTVHEKTRGNGDLVAHFFRRAFSLLAREGAFGLIASNSIAQGDTRLGGLEQLLKDGGWVYRATKRMRWPGEAAVVVSIVHLLRNAQRSPILNGRNVTRVSAYLMEGILDESPARLVRNRRGASKGSDIGSIAFTFDDESSKTAVSPISEMKKLLAAEPQSSERILPFIGGEEVNSSPDHSPHRFVISVSDLTERELGSRYPKLFQLLKERVKPERESKAKKRQDGANLAEAWWRFERPRQDLYNSIKGLRRAIAISQTTKHLAFTFLPSQVIVSSKLVVFASDRDERFAQLQSRVHELWALQFGTTMKDDPVYTTGECFETFAFIEDEKALARLGSIGDSYFRYRARVLISRNEGLTKVCNRIHDPSETSEDIARLRDLHVELDRTVLAAYGWSDLAAKATPFFLDEENEDDYAYQNRLFWPSDFRDEVLARLLALNAERHAEEVRLGIAPGMKSKADDDEEVDDAE
jgi:hypothetical protein